MKKAAILLIILISVLAAKIYFNDNSILNQKDSSLEVLNYIPKEVMTKEFSGGFEKEGFIQIIDKVEGDKFQVKEIDAATGQIRVYQASELEIKTIYLENTDDKFKDNYLNMQPNRNEIILKAPIKQGTKWKDEIGEYEITDVNVRAKTSVGTFYTIEVTLKTESNLIIKSYYAKDIGLVKRIVEGYGEDNLINLEYEVDPNLCPQCYD